MRRLAFAATLIVLNGCTGAGSEAPTSAWLIGAWLEMSDGTQHPLACDSGLPILYKADGTYSLFEEEGTWRLEGNVLTEIATEVTGAGDPAEVDIGKPYVSTVVRTGQNDFRKRLATGELLEFRRCPGHP